MTICWNTLSCCILMMMVILIGIEICIAAGRKNLVSWRKTENLSRSKSRIHTSTTRRTSFVMIIVMIQCARSGGWSRSDTGRVATRNMFERNTMTFFVTIRRCSSLIGIRCIGGFLGLGHLYLVVTCGWLGENNTMSLVLLILLRDALSRNFSFATGRMSVHDVNTGTILM